MSESLVIRIDATPEDSASWIAVDQTGALLGPVARGALADAGVAAAGRSVVVLLPAREVLRVAADVPVKGGGKLLQALPFALEEQLAEDVDTLHFAAGARGADGRLQAAVVRREAMDALLGRLAAAGLATNQVYSEADAVGGMPNTATVLVQADGAILCEPDGAISTIDADGVGGLLELWLARHARAGAEAPPPHLVVYGEPDLLDHLDVAWEGIRERVESLELRALNDGALPRMAAQVATAPGVNLLQGDYARRSGLMALLPAWRVAAALLLALGVVGLAAEIADIRRMRAEAAALDVTIDQAFHYVFPGAGPIQDARAQLSSQLQRLGEQGPKGSHEFLDVLRAIAQAVASNSAAKIEAVNYRSGTLELRVRAPSVEALDHIQQLVSQGGSLKAQIQSANASGNEVVGRLQITRAGG